MHKSSNLCALYIGTGLGLGIIESGRALHGVHNMASELGHIPYKEAPFSCGCGRSNCIELFASGSGMKKWANHYKLTTKLTLGALNKCDDKVIPQMFEKALLYAAGISITLFNPEVLVLGGGIIMSNTYLKDIINEHIDDYALPQALKDVKICLSNLDNAPLKGALLLKDYNG